MDEVNALHVSVYVAEMMDQAQIDRRKRPELIEALEP